MNARDVGCGTYNIELLVRPFIKGPPEEGAVDVRESGPVSSEVVRHHVDPVKEP